MISSTEGSADLRKRQICHLPADIHRDLTGLGEFPVPFLRFDIRYFNVVFLAYSLLDRFAGDIDISHREDICEIYDNAGMDLTLGRLNQGGAAVSEMGAVVKSDHLAEFTASAGLYFNIPLSERFSLGTKCLIGRSITQELDIDGYAKGYVKDIDYSLTIKNGEIVSGSLDYPKNTPTNDQYDTEWDFLTLGASNSTSWGTGLSLTYRYKSNFSWRIYCDYDYTKKTFTMTYDPNNDLRSQQLS